MSVGRRGSAAGLVLGATTALSGAVLSTTVLAGTGWAQDATPTLAPDDPSISEQQVGCAPDPTICQSGLPRTGPREQLLLTGAVGAGLLVAGAGAVVAGRRRTT